MATAPRVQTLAEAMRDLDPAYAASRDMVAKRQQALPGKYEAQRAGIYAARGEGFNAINNQATGRGASFSGIPQDEQARYLSTKFLPGLQQADFQQNEEDLNLQGQLAGIDKEQRLGAQSRVDKQQSDLNSWNQMIAQQNALARAGKAPKNLSPYESAMSIIGAAASKGGVSANAFQLARDAYRLAGGDTHQFAKEFWKYVPEEAQKDFNSKGWKYYYG